MEINYWIEWYENFVLNIEMAIMIAFLVMLVMYFHVFIYALISLFSKKRPKKGENKYRYAVLIPARNEANVIRNPLSSLINQTYPKELFDVYVIVEKEDDPTVEIVKEYGYKTIVRGNIEGRRTKGYALDDAYHYLKNNNLKYDAFIIFDSDNINSSDYIDLLNDYKNQGYKITSGYRNFSNGEKNWVTKCSSILFSFINNFLSKGQSALFKKVTLTGTGYYIDTDIVDDAGGWIWNGMAEDTELTRYAYYHNIPMSYAQSAMYYDEQTPSMKIAHTQHVRWIWGYMSDKKKYKNCNDSDYKALNKIRRFFANSIKVTSLYPLAIFIILLVLSIILSLSVVFAATISSFYIEELKEYLVGYLKYSVRFSLMLYLFFVLFALFTFACDNQNLKFKFSSVLITSFTYFFFLADFALAFLDGLFHKSKRNTWSKIAHGNENTSDKANEVLNGKNKKK